MDFFKLIFYKEEIKLGVRGKRKGRK